MKIRNGFVSNSSSSSFLILGTDDEELIKVLLEAEGIDDVKCDYGIYEGKIINFYGCYKDIYYAGIPLSEKDLENNTLSEIRKEFISDIKEKLNVDITNCFNLFYGEIGE